MKKILLIPHLKILNANALSSPYSIGFPAMTAWLGASHALERKLKSKGYSNLKFRSMGVVCHELDLQVYKGSGDYVYSITGTGNPLKKNGERSSFVEEGRCHLDVSLVVEYDQGSGLIDFDEFNEDVGRLVQGEMKFAGGDSLHCDKPAQHIVRDEASLRALLRHLMPGHCLIERRDLMLQAMEDGQDAIDAMLDFLKITHTSTADKSGKVTWTSSRKEKGWIVPIATGFHGISEPGIAGQQRDPDTTHRFAESVVTLGEFVMPYRVNDLDNMLWHYHADLRNDLYLCQQNQPAIQIQEINHG